MIYTAAFLAVAFFMVGVRMFRVVTVARTVISASHSAVRIMRDPSVRDEDRERVLQSASITLLRSFVSITLRSAAALVLSLAPLVALQAAGVTTVSEVVELLATWKAIVVTTIGLMLVYLVWKKL